MTLLTLFGGFAPRVAISVRSILPSVTVVLRGQGQFYDLTPNLKTGIIKDDEHGFQSASISAALPIDLIADIYQQIGQLECIVSSGETVLWNGRVEDPGFKEDTDGTELSLSCFGWQSAYDDAIYNEFFSDTSYKHWQVSTEFNTPKFQTDIRNRLWLALVKGTTYVAGNDYGNVLYISPVYKVDSGNPYYNPPLQTPRHYKKIIFDYTVYLPLNWSVGFGYVGSNLWTLVSDNTLQTGHIELDIDFTGTEPIFLVYPTANYTETSETAIHYARFINVRIATSSQPEITAYEIMMDVAQHCHDVNPSIIPAPEPALIADPSFDLHDEAYADARASKIFDRLMAIGETYNLTPWSWWIDEERRLRTGNIVTRERNWYVTVSSIDMQRLFRTIYNQVYASFGDNLASPMLDWKDSINRYKVVRQTSIKAGNVTPEEAASQANIAVIDKRNPAPRARLSFETLYDRTGVEIPLHECRSGDTLTIKNLPPDMQLLAVRNFRVVATTYDLISGKYSVDLETPPARLEVLLARKKES